MKLPDLEIRIGALSKLSTTITDTVIRDSMLLPDDDLPAIILSSQTLTQDNLKTQFGGQATLLVQVIGKKSLTVSRYEIDQIADKVITTLIPMDRSDFIDVDGFEVVNVSLDSLNDSVITENDGVSARKLIRIRFLLRQLNN